jgi:class 3 adenylate cyclase
MFISCYVFDSHERIALTITIFIQLSLFIAMQNLPEISTIDSVLSFANGNVVYLKHIAYVNSWVFGFSCLICALFIRSILSKNWQQLKKYEATQTLLLHKLFPVELMPQLLSTINTSVSKTEPLNTVTTGNLRQNTLADMQQSLSMGVMFLDIVDFTEQTNKDTQPVVKKALDWQSTYGLFAKFDKAIAHIDAKRIKTNGDQYILVIGLNSQHESNDTIALHTIEACVRIHTTSSLKIRIGCAFGPVTCGIFDSNNPNFDIWGETVIRAARLEKLALSNQTLADQAIYHYTAHKHSFAPGVQHNMKGLGVQNVYSHEP